jgi:hypothetical protein
LGVSGGMMRFHATNIHPTKFNLSDYGIEQSDDFSDAISQLMLVGKLRDYILEVKGLSRTDSKKNIEQFVIVLSGNEKHTVRLFVGDGKIIKMNYYGVEKKRLDEALKKNKLILTQIALDN